MRLRTTALLVALVITASALTAQEYGPTVATAVIELVYTIAREPFVRNGHDIPGADPAIIAWAGAAGFLGGLVGTEVCRRRR